jgi:hypothetical protein
MSILDTAREVVGIVQKIDNIELYKQILGLQSDILKLFEENTNLHQEISSLTEQLKIKAALIYDRQLDAYICKDANDQIDGPFCTVCWDSDKKLIRMSQGGYNGHYCGYCTTVRGKG